MGRSAEIAAVRSVIMEYVEGTAQQDPARVKGAFHPDAVMSGYIGGNKLVGSPQPFLDHLEAEAPGAGYTAEIAQIDVTGLMATARLLEDDLFGLSFVTEFHLLKEDGAWRIVSKLFHHDPPPAG